MEKILIFLQKWRVRLGHVFAVVILVFARPQPGWLAVGTALALAGEAIRVVSAGYIRKDTALSASGPYAFTRNPLYLGSFLMYLGFCVASANVFVLAAYIPLFFVVYYAAIVREEACLESIFGEEYAKYCGEVPRFFPRIPGTRHPAPGTNSGDTIRNSTANSGHVPGIPGSLPFSFAQTVKNREYEAMVAAVVVLGLLWAMWLTGCRIAG